MRKLRGIRHGKSEAARKYGVSPASVKRWSRRYNGTWQPLREKSRRPHHSPRRHSEAEEKLLKEVFVEKYQRFGWDGMFTEALKHGYKRNGVCAAPDGPGDERKRKGTAKKE